MNIEEILAGESKNIKFKMALPEKSIKYMKSVIAFANGRGGKLIFGVRDEDQAIVGIESAYIFKTMDAITNAISDSCEPAIVPDVTLQAIAGKTIIIVDVPKGMQKPYYIKSKGVVEGTYVRVSGTTRQVDRYLLQELILEGTNRSFDQQSSDTIVLEEQVQEFCEKMYNHALEMSRYPGQRELIQPVTRNQLISWQLLKEIEGQLIPSNGYLLLAGDNVTFPQAKIQCAVFKGTTRDIFITKKEFTSPLYQQLEDAYHFVLQNIRLGSRIDGLYRQDIYELPIRSIREMIANAACHRSYLNSSSIQVALYDDRLEVTSPGMLHDELTINQMKQGMSKIWNKGISEAFSYMNIIEAWGSGIPRILREAKEYGLREPELIEMGHDFRINLFRAESTYDKYGVVDPKLLYETSDSYSTKDIHDDPNGTKEINDGTNDTKDINDDTNGTKDGTNGTKDGTKDGTNKTNDTNINRILALILDNPEITQKDLCEQMSLSIRTVKRIVSDLQKNNIIKREGSSRKGKWKIM